MSYSLTEIFNIKMLDIRIVVGLIALVTAVFSSLVTFVCGRYASEKDEKREMYAQAYKSLVRWKEMVYKVSRRKKEDESEIRSEFHEIQVDAAFYEGWIAGSSPSLSKSFIFSMNGVKACCKDPIHKAWDRSGSEGDVGELIDNKKIREFTTSFIKDIRLQLSPWLIPHIILWMHNRRRD